MQALIAAFFYTIAVFSVFNAIQADSDLKMALIDGPPSAINIGDYDPKTGKTGLREVHIVAQLDILNTMEYVKETSSRLTKKTLIPLLEIDSSNPRPLGIVVLGNTKRQIDQLLDSTIGQGAVGPIVKINGTTASAYNYRAEIEGIFQADYGYYDADMLYVQPFFEQRDTILEGGGPEWFVATLFGGVGSIFAALSIYKFRRRSKLAVGMPSSKKMRSKAKIKTAERHESPVVRRNR